MRKSLSPRIGSPIRLKPAAFSTLNDSFLNKTIDLSSQPSPRNSKLPPLNTCVRSFYRLTDRPSQLHSTYYKRQIIGTRGLSKRSQIDRHNIVMPQVDQIGTVKNSNITSSLHRRNSSNQYDTRTTHLPTLALGSGKGSGPDPTHKVSKLDSFSIELEDLYESDIKQTAQKPEASFKPTSSTARRNRRNNHNGSLFTGLSSIKSASTKSTAKVQEQNVIITINAPSIFIKSPTREFTYLFQMNEITKLFWAKSSYNSSFLNFLLSRSSFVSEEINGEKNTVFQVNISNLDTREDSMYGLGVEHEIAELNGETFECTFNMPYVTMLNPETKETFSRELGYRHMVDLISGYYDTWEKIAKDCF